MNFQMSGDGVKITPALRDYALLKLGCVTRHFDKVVKTSMLLRFNPHADEKHRHTVTIDLHMKGNHIHVEFTNGDMYDTINHVVECLDRQVVRYKDCIQDHHHVTHRRFADAHV